MLFSCSSEYPELKYTPDNAESLNKEVRGTIAITPTLNYSSIFFVSASRGSGAFDRDHYLSDFEQHYMNAKFYVLGFRRAAAEGEMSQPVDFTQLMNKNTNPDRKDCLFSTTKVMLGELEQPGKLMMPMDFTGALKYMDDETGTKEDERILWNEVYGTTGYDFYGYYYDDAKINSIKTTEEKVTMDVTIDGTQDLMIGMAPEITRSLLEQHYPGVVEQQTKDKILAYGEGAYTTFGAGHSVQPKIDMKHCLARLMVYCNQVDAAAQVKVKDVRLKARTNGIMTVAARNHEEVGFTPTGGYSVLHLPNINVPLEYKKDVLLGPGVMIPEEDQYELELVFEETYFKDEAGTQTETKTSVYPFVIKMDNDTFHAGTSYYIKLTMYGVTGADIDVSTNEHWMDGGTIDIGTQD